MKKRLGRGLDSLFSTDEREDTDSQYQMIEVGKISPNPFQPRKVFGKDELDELRRSIAEKGVLQPVLVRVVPDGYQLIVGERRLRASKLEGLPTIPAVVKDVSDNQLLEIALIENIQRKDLNPVEKALAYRQLVDGLGMTHEDVARRVGKNRSSITNYMRLLELPEEVRELIAEGLLTMGHARAIASLTGEREKIEAAKEVVRKRLSVRDTEKSLSKSTPKKKSKPEKPDDRQAKDLERQLEESLLTKIKIVRKSIGGHIVIDFYSDDEFTRLFDLLSQ